MSNIPPPPPARAESGPAVSPTDLSTRELLVLRLLALGYSNKEIAARVGLSVKTVETYKARGFEKLGVRRRVEFIRYAVAAGWLLSADPPDERSAGCTAHDG